MDPHFKGVDVLVIKLVFVCIVHVKRGVEERETSLALLRPDAGLKQYFEVGVKRLLSWNEDPHIALE